jgi:hypothetical protein
MGTGATPRAAWDALQASQGQPWAGWLYADPAQVLGERFAAARALERGLRL